MLSGLLFFSSFFDSGVTWYLSVDTDGAFPTLESGGAVDFPECGWGRCATSLPRRLSDFVFGEEAVFHLPGWEAVRLLGNI